MVVQKVLAKYATNVIDQAPSANRYGSWWLYTVPEVKIAISRNVFWVNGGQKSKFAEETEETISESAYEKYMEDWSSVGIIELD